MIFISYFFYNLTQDITPEVESDIADVQPRSRMRWPKSKILLQVVSKNRQVVSKNRQQKRRFWDGNC
jgi:hypothetical protein